MMIYWQDLRKAKMCHKGARQWFSHYGLDWSDFVHNGIDSAILLSTGDAYAKQLIETVEQWEAAKAKQ